MAQAIAHRGPDDTGCWIDTEAGVGLAHRRLAIVDLSPNGHQPMVSADGRFVISFNGEIYNHRDLKLALEADGEVPDSGWKGRSDTEVLLQAIAAWGLERALAASVGMFAFALWDRAEQQLRLVRDRFGEKPLYYGWAGKDFLFASELKALRAHPEFTAEIDRRALRLFAARTCVPGPWSIYRGVFKLPPACILTAGPGMAPLRIDRYWSYRDIVLEGLADPIRDPRDALQALDECLGRAIRDQSVADVPVGAFLSGGIDSSTIVALHRKYSRGPVRTFTIGFAERGFDEARQAKAVAGQLGTVHEEHYVTVDDARAVIPLLPAVYDEPFADSSQIPTFLVSRFAREKVSVALTGDGGDELFAGYNRHVLAPRLWAMLAPVPRPARAVIARLFGQLFPGGKTGKLLRVAGSARSFDDIYLSFLDEWSGEEGPVIGGELAPHGFELEPGLENRVRMTTCDATSYLPDDILCKVDRASMAVGLETRLPFLDHRVAAVAARIPVEMKVRNGRGKHILRELLYREAPRELFDHPKSGFAIPVGEWIRGPLRDWAEDLLDEKRMREAGWFDPAVVQARWSDHLAGRRDSTPAIWAVLMFEAWRRAR
jgi:asparagine synthase (glutamine-hydrolysing)